MGFKESSKLVVSHLVRFSNVLILKFIFKCEALNFNFLLEFIHQLLECFIGTYFRLGFRQSVFLHLILCIVLISSVNCFFWVVLQNNLFYNCIHKVFIFEISSINVILEMGQQLINFFIRQFRDVYFEDAC